jgi:hypothetical protein
VKSITTDIPFRDESANLLAVTEEGSPVSTQIWYHDSAPFHQNVWQRLLEWWARGEVERHDKYAWNKPIVHAYVRFHGHDETFHVDLTNPDKVAILRRLAGKEAA